MRRLLLLLGALTAMLTVPIPNSQAQDTRTPTWSKGAWSVNLEYSLDGSIVVGTENSTTIRVWSTATRKLLAVLGGSFNSSTPAYNGAGVYYVTGNPAKVYYYNLSTHTTTLVKAEASPLQGGGTICTSTDGSMVAYNTYNGTTGRYQIRIMNSSTGVQVGNYNMPVGDSVLQVAFCVNNTRVAIGGSGGVRLVNSNPGTNISAKTGLSNFALSPDRTKAYAKNPSTGTLYAIDLTTATAPTPTLWSVASSTIDSNFKCSSDGNVLVSGGSDVSNDFAYYAIRFYRTTDGSEITDGLSYSTTYNAPYYASNPITNEVIFFNLQGGPRIRRWTFNSSTGIGSEQTVLDGGTGGTTLQAFGTSTPFFASEDPFYGGLRARNATTGEETSSTAKYGVKYSPDGQYFAWIGSRESDNAYGVHVYRVSDGVRVASYNSSNVIGAGWGRGGHLWAQMQTVNKARVMSFSGSSLTLVNEVSGPSSSTCYLSEDATRFVWINSNLITVYNVTTATEVGNFEGGGSTYAIQAGFSGNDFWFHDWLDNGDSTYVNRIQVRDVSSNAFTLLRTASYTTSTSYGSDYGVASLSNDESVAVFGRYTGTGADGRAQTEVKVVRMADNTVLRTYNSQFSDWYFNAIAIATDNVTLATLGYYAQAMVASELPVILKSVTLSPNTVVGGNNSAGTVTLNRAAPTGGVTVTLSSNNGAASVPASVTVTEGNTSANFNITTTGVTSDQQVQVTATYDGLGLSAVLTVTKPTAIAISFSPNSVNGGQSSTGTASINGKAPTGGYTVNLASDKASVTVPGSVTIPEGQTSVTFTATTTDPGTTETATITGSNGAVSGQGTLQVIGGSATVAFVETAIKGGNALTLRITIPNPAPVGGTTFNLSGDALSAPPATAKIAEGKTTIDVGVNTNATLNNATTTVSVTPAAGGATKQASATVQAPLIRALYLAQSPVAGVKTVKLLVLLDGIAPSGLSFNVTASAASVTVPATVTIPAGALFATIDVVTKKQTAKKTVKITIGSKFVNIILQAQP